MNSLPDEINQRILAHLPQVDAYRLRRVSPLFDWLLMTDLATLELDHVEIGFQLKERGFSKKDFELVVKCILTHYGPSVLRLKVHYSGCGYSNKTDVIVKCCPNLEQLELMEYPACSTFEKNFCSLRYSEFDKLKKLTKLKAELSLKGCTSTEAAAIADRLSGLKELSSLILDPEGAWFLNWAFQVAGLKKLHCRGIALERVISKGTGVNLTDFSNVDGMKFTYKTPVHILNLLPESLSQLQLQYEYVNLDMPSLDLSACKFLQNLTSVKLKNVNLTSYKFLQSCIMMDSLDLCWCEPKFDREAFSNIPTRVTLRHIGIENNCIDLALPGLIHQRNWPLRTIVFGNLTKPLPGYDCAVSPVGLLRQCAASLETVSLSMPSPCYIADGLLEMLGDINTFPLLSYINVPSITTDGVRKFVEQRSGMGQARVGKSRGHSDMWGTDGVKTWNHDADVPLLRLVVDVNLEFDSISHLACKKANVLFLNVHDDDVDK